MPANSYVICRSLEYLRIPRETLVLCFGKSTYARSGVLVNITPLEPEWEGHITISVSNTSPFPVRLYANEGIAQIVFIEAKDLCEVSYADKKGKYQAQKGIVLPKV
jgi:dCTP deaminase